MALAATVALGVGAWRLYTNKPATAKADKPPAGAKVPQPVKEEDLNSVVLTPEAEKRIGLTVGDVQKKSVRRSRVYGGEVVVPPGKAILVSSPLAGVVRQPPGEPLAAGRHVSAGQVLIHLLPLLSPDGRATISASLTDAEGQAANAKTQLDLAQVTYDRALGVFRDGAGSKRQVDEAQAALDVAKKTLNAADARRSILAKVLGDAESGTAAPMPIAAPFDGMIRVVSATPHQNVPSGAPLFEIADLSTMWVRAPVPVGDVAHIDRTAAAQVGEFGSDAKDKRAVAKPAPAPPSGNALTATVDLFYELPNANNALVPGERLAVWAPLHDAAESNVVPWSAIVLDVHGGAWIYRQAESHRYVRTRVDVRYTVADDAVLEDGPAVGTKIVTAGVQQLFAAETGFIK
jgi:RND family efflux transporter MFP subunit